MSTLDLSRWQFGITTVYHFIFVPLTIGLAPLIAIMQTAWVVNDSRRSYAELNPQTMEQAQAAAQKTMKDLQAAELTLSHFCVLPKAPEKQVAAAWMALAAIAALSSRPTFCCLGVPSSTTR